MLYTRGRRRRGKQISTRRRRRARCPRRRGRPRNRPHARGVNDDAAAAQLWWPLPLSSLPQYSVASALQCIPLHRQASEQTGNASKSLTSVQSSFLIFVRTGHSSWARRAGRKAVAVTNGGAAAAAATARPARAVVRRSITKSLGARAVLRLARCLAHSCDRERRSLRSPYSLDDHSRG